jgi:alkylation response protein AidB-like acyl-CoA dehydrogenase
MSDYRAPLTELLFCIRHHAGRDEELDLAQSILEECGKFGATVLDPMNGTGDRIGATWQDGGVTTAPGFKEAFRDFSAGGWMGLQHPIEFGGQGLAKPVAAACIEIINSANTSFSLCPLLSDGAIEALLTAGSAALKAAWLPPMVAGRWAGTMNLTEPQAGSDLSLVRTRAEPASDGTYRIFGTKIFITYGDHDLTENIVHLVLARTPGAPEGVKGISLFVVPKFLTQADGTLGARNDVYCASIEHKLGIHASPTAVLQYGNDGGAIGYLVGEENRGLEYMFVMMNAARFSVGMQGVAVAERAYQKAVAYARERVQSRPVDGSTPHSVTIIHHPDVRRMLMTMRAHTEAARALGYLVAGSNERARTDPDEAMRRQSKALYEFLVPLFKGYATQMSQVVASLGIQVHGGMGFIEETGAAQLYRDARILSLYEGTTAIQANDLIGRKTVRDRGATARWVAREIAATEAQLERSGTAAAAAVLKYLRPARAAYGEVVEFVLERYESDRNVVFAGSVAYLMLAASTVAGWQLARALLIAAGSHGVGGFGAAKVATARFYAEHVLSQVPGQRDVVIGGGESVLGMALEGF